MAISDQMVMSLAAAAFPTIAVLVGILINNSRFDDMNRRFDDTHRRIDDMRDVLRSEMFRIEQVLDARLKHLEEHL